MFLDGMCYSFNCLCFKSIENDHNSFQTLLNRNLVPDSYFLFNCLCLRNTETGPYSLQTFALVKKSTTEYDDIIWIKKKEI